MKDEQHALLLRHSVQQTTDAGAPRTSVSLTMTQTTVGTATFLRATRDEEERERNRVESTYVLGGMGRDKGKRERRGKRDEDG